MSDSEEVDTRNKVWRAPTKTIFHEATEIVNKAGESTEAEQRRRELLEKHTPVQSLRKPRRSNFQLGRYEAD